MTPREKQTEKCRQRAIKTGRAEDLRKYLQMRQEDNEEAHNRVGVRRRTSFEWTSSSF